MFCVKTPGTERLCEYATCTDFDVETGECLYNIFPAWLKQTADHLKHNTRLSKFKTITALCEEYLKIAVR